MTPATLRKRVAYWQKTLKPLGLEHWNLEVDVVEDPSPGATRDASAAVSCSTHYDTAWLEFREDWLPDAPDEEIDKVIIHELLHVAMRDFDHEADKPEEFLGVVVGEVWQSGMKHAREALVEKLARTLYLAYSSNVVQSPK